MSRREAIRLVAARELNVRLRSRAFLVSTAITAAVLVALALLSGGKSDTKTWKVAGVGPGAHAAVATAGEVAPGFKGQIRSRPAAGDRGARRAVLAGDLDAAVLSSGAIAVKDDRSSDLVRVLQAGSARARGVAVLKRAGIPEAQRTRLLAPPPLRVAALDDRPRSRGDAAVALTGALVLYLALVSYGIAVAHGVVEEKSSRVIEIVVSTIRSSDLLAGKVLGVGLAGLLQLLVVGGVGVAVGVGTGALAVPSGTAGALALVVVEFLLGYALYSALFAACAAVVSRSEDLQSVTAPVTIVLVAGYIASNSALQDPGSGLAKVLSILPFTSPIVLPGRVALHVATTAEVALSLALSVAAIPLAIAFAGRLYRGAVLFTGARVPFRAAWRGG